jgi:hypothetical protein
MEVLMFNCELGKRDALRCRVDRLPHRAGASGGTLRVTLNGPADTEQDAMMRAAVAG